MVKKVTLMAMVLCYALVISGCVTTGTFEQKVQEAQTFKQQSADLGKENEGLKGRVAKLTGEVAALAKEKENLTKEKEKLTGRNNELQSDLGAKADELSRSILELRQKYTILDNDNLRLKEEIAVLQKVKEEEVQKTSKTYEELLEKMKGEISKGEVTISELKGKLTVNLVDAILFDSGKAEVKPDGLVVLQKVIDILQGIKDKMIRVEGHTDNLPIHGALAKRFPSNWELAAARSINVARYLQERGIDPNLLAAIAYGEFKPVATNDTEEGRAKNRRIEIILVPKE
jgi:chemotaxis protein MotB